MMVRHEKSASSTRYGACSSVAESIKAGGYVKARFKCVGAHPAARRLGVFG